MILCIAWTILIFVLCTIPPSNIPKIKIANIDKAAHFGFFFIQSVLLSLLLRFWLGKRKVQIIFFSTLQAFIYGGLIEFLQDRFFNRTGDLYDLIADVLGGFFGALIIASAYKKKVRKYK